MCPQPKAISTSPRAGQIVFVLGTVVFAMVDVVVVDAVYVVVLVVVLNDGIYV